MLLRIEAASPGDTAFRLHGLAIDGSLPRSFWMTRPDLILANTHTPFIYEASIEASYSITYGNSSYAIDPRFPNYGWNTKIFLNGELVAEGVVGRDQHLTVIIGAPPNGEASSYTWLIASIGSIVLGLGLGFISAREEK